MQNRYTTICDQAMDFLALINQSLKSAKVIELLECHDMEVVYKFDRLFEGGSDEYQSKSVEDGFEFIFDSAQRLNTVLLYVRPREEFAAVDVSSVDVPVYASVDAAREAFERNGDAIKPGSGWIKGLAAGVWRHDEFHDGRLSLVTLMRNPV